MADVIRMRFCSWNRFSISHVCNALELRVWNCGTTPRIWLGYKKTARKHTQPFSEELLCRTATGPLNSQDCRLSCSGLRIWVHSIFAKDPYDAILLRGWPSSIKFGRLMRKSMPITVIWWKSKPEVEFQYGGRLFSKLEVVIYLSRRSRCGVEIWFADRFWPFEDSNVAETGNM